MRLTAWRRGSVKQRVIWAVTATVAVFLGLQAILAYLAMDAQEDDLSDELLRREVRQLLAHAARPGLLPEGPLPAAPRVTAHLARSAAGEAALPPYLQHLAPGMYQRFPSGQTLHVAVLDSDDGRLIVALDATESERRVNHFGYTLAGLWLLGVAIAALIARAVAAIAVGPLSEATLNIGRWLPPAPAAAAAAPRQDEAAILMETFNRFRDNADEAIARQRDFSANLEHEIRTPLTAIRTDAELIGVEATLGAAERARVERIIASVDEITATTQAALSASAGKAQGAERLDVGEVVGTVCEALADRAVQRGLSIDIGVSAGALLHGDRQALLTVCRNIVGNAIEHAAPAHLQIGGDAGRLWFEDDGPGIDAVLLPDVFERYHRGRRRDEAAAADPAGRGLGLAIAKRVCDLRGWQLSVRSPAANGLGTRFVLAFDDRH